MPETNRIRSQQGVDTKARFAMLAAVACLGSPPAFTQPFSWDPLKDVQEALPEGTPNEGKIIQARQQVREMTQDALSTLYEIAPNTRRVIKRSAGYAVFSAPSSIRQRTALRTTARLARPVVRREAKCAWTDARR